MTEEVERDNKLNVIVPDLRSISTVQKCAQRNEGLKIKIGERCKNVVGLQ